MKYYEHELYLKRKYAREQMDRFFEIVEGDKGGIDFESIFNALAGGVLDKCVENKNKTFSTYVYNIFSGMSIRNNKISDGGFYLMTESQIKKNLKNFDYEKSKSFIKRYSYYSHMPDYKVFGVFIKGVKK